MIKLMEQTFSTKMEKILFDFESKVRSVEKKEKNNFDIYDIELGSGIKFSKVEKILPEIGLGLKSKSIPRGYPVLSKGVYRVEVQTKDFDNSNLEDYFSNFENKFCPIVIGSNSSGEKIVSDLSKFPNMLIAGATGSGKSVVLHNIILSLIKNKSEIYLVDPKMVEFTAYDDLSQIKSISYSAEEASSLIENINVIMNQRFSLLKQTKSRNIQEYNRKNFKI